MRFSTQLVDLFNRWAFKQKTEWTVRAGLSGYGSRNIKSPQSLWNFGFHTLMHSLLGFTLAQDVEKKKAEPKTPHFLSLNQDIVAGSQEGKCGV